MDNSQVPNDAVIATPSDSTPCHGHGVLYTGGTCVVETSAGNSVVLPAAFAGVVIPLRIAKVKAASTATSILVFR